MSDVPPSRADTKGTAAKRTVGYFRVSSEEQLEGYSIAAQERAYRQYVETHGYLAVGEYKDEGKSARTDNIRRRPAFAQMLQDAQGGPLRHYRCA